MKNTIKKKQSINQTKKKNSTKKCMEKFAEKKIKYWTGDYTKEITKLENKKNSTKEEKILLKKLKKQKVNQIKSLKKQYKLMNCNINCKGTLAEPGPPNQIPKSMQKFYGYSKPLIKIFTKRRKEIFKNKTNVLIDNFYENISPKIKKKLLKEGAISDCSLPLSSNESGKKKLTGGSIIYEDGQNIKTEETFNGKPFFRKVFYYDAKSDDLEKKTRLEKAAKAEIAIANVLMKNPFPNIVTIYDVNNKYIELEQLDTISKLDKTKLIEVMRLTKDFLQSLGIMYIDWKPDNIGISEDGTYKLFDFDASGLLDINNPNVWIVKPIEEYYSYRKAIENGITDPKEIDNYAFNKEIVNAKNYRFK